MSSIETKVILVRHGETEWNREGRIQGYHANSNLTETGHAQARAVAARLAGEGIDALYASDSGRTMQTAQPIATATGLALSQDIGVRERNYGIFEGYTFAEVEKVFPAEFEKYRVRDPHYSIEGGESAIQFRDRIVAAFGEIARRHIGKRSVVVTHGGVIGSMYRVATEQPLDAPRVYTTRNASVNRFKFEGERWVLEVWGDVAHLGEESLDDE
ncbi:MAG: histidine phosphatase family protein [Burkholderiales bacterium]